MNETNLFPRTALVYAYKTKDAEKWGIDPNEVSLAYQVSQPLAPHQCDFGKDMTSRSLKEFKHYGGGIKLVTKKEDLVLPLSEHKVLVLPVPPQLLKEWGLVALLD
jgi:hypothetical protein